MKKIVLAMIFIMCMTILPGCSLLPSSESVTENEQTTPIFSTDAQGTTQQIDQVPVSTPAPVENVDFTKNPETVTPTPQVPTVSPVVPNVTPMVTPEQTSVPTPVITPAIPEPTPDDPWILDEYPVYDPTEEDPWILDEYPVDDPNEEDSWELKEY